MPPPDTPETRPVPDLPGDDKQQQNGIPIVGIGASAGGLDAMTQLLRALPADTGMGFVLVQHLDPGHQSKLAEILGRATTMPVQEVQHNAAVEPNHLYIIPPNMSLAISGAVLQLSPRSQAVAPHFLIDRFLCSLAEDAGGQA